MGRGSSGAAPRCSRRATGPRVMRKAFQHQEGNGAGDGERLHERRKALKGEPHERIWHETRPAGSGRIKASRGRENLKAQAVGRGKPGPRKAAAPGGENAVGERTSWEEPFIGSFGFAVGRGVRFRSYARASGGQARKRTVLGSFEDALAFGRLGNDEPRFVAEGPAGRKRKRWASVRRESSRLGSKELGGGRSVTGVL
jgi:hypothetical protein